MALFKKKSAAEKDRKAEIKAAKKDARSDKKDARKDARADKKDARKDARADKKDARQGARAEKKEARADFREDKKDIRQSDLKGKDKRDAKKDARGDKKDTIKDARADKKDTRREANQQKKDLLHAANAEKKETIAEIRERKRAALKALRVPKAMDRKWVSYLRFQTVKALEIYKPKTLAHIQTVCRIATENDVKVRAIGSGHSFSAIGQTDDIFVTTDQMDKMFTLGAAKRKRRFKPEFHNARKHPMAEFEVGRKIIELSKDLEKSNHALENQGTYDGQTFWGAVSTSTHGSGSGRPPFPEMVLSFVMVGEGGRTYRIEPKDGITNPKGWNEAGIDELIQDNDTFYSAVCSFGSMGVVYSAVIRLRSFYWLDEWNFITTWETFKTAFADPATMLSFMDQWATMSLLVSPTKAPRGDKKGVEMAGKFPTSVTLRRETEEKRKIGGTLFFDGIAKAFENVGIISGKSPAEGRKFLPRFHLMKKDDSWLGRTSSKQAGKIAWHGERIDEHDMPAINRRNKCYKIFPKGGKLFGGYGNEFAFPAERTIEIMDKLHKFIKKNDDDLMFHTAPVAVRWVAPSRAYASPQYDGRGKQVTVMFEVLMAKGTKDGPRALKRIEEFMLKEDGVRVHWGLNMDVVSAGTANFARMYPKWRQFKTVWRRFNGKRTFANEFTDRIGLK